MAVVLKGACSEVNRSQCEKPHFPCWAWRFNRNQHMTDYIPWQIREEQKLPHYRNMGMHRDFRFHPMGPNDGPRPFLQLGVNLCHDLNHVRQVGFGNAALGRSPGPAPPRLFVYGQQGRDDLYPINEVNPITPGMSLFGYQPLPRNTSDDDLVPLNPSHYMEQTLGQLAEIPGTFPHFNKALPSTSARPSRVSATQTSCDSRDPLNVWRERFAEQQARHAMERCGCPPTKSPSQTSRPYNHSLNTRHSCKCKSAHHFEFLQK